MFRDRRFLAFAAIAFVFPLQHGHAWSTASPLFGADLGLGEGYIGLVLGGNSILVALLAAAGGDAHGARTGPFRWLGRGGARRRGRARLLRRSCRSAAAALVAGTVVFSFGELMFSSAVPAAVARLAPPGRRGAYQGAWTLVRSFSMGSALFVSGLLRDSIGWTGAWLIYAAVAGGAGLLLLAARQRFLRAAPA